MARICRIGPLRCCTRGLSWFGALWMELWQKVHFSIQPAATPLCHPLPLLPSPASPKRCAAASQSLAHARHARCGAARRVWAALAHSEGPRAPLFTFHFSHTHAQHAHTLCSEVPPQRPWGALTRSIRCAHSLRCRTRVFSWFGAFSGALRPSFHLSPRTRSGPLFALCSLFLETHERNPPSATCYRSARLRRCWGHALRALKRICGRAVAAAFTTPSTTLSRPRPLLTHTTLPSLPLPPLPLPAPAAQDTARTCGAGSGVSASFPAAGGRAGGDVVAGACFWGACDFPLLGRGRWLLVAAGGSHAAHRLRRSVLCLQRASRFAGSLSSFPSTRLFSFSPPPPFFFLFCKGPAVRHVCSKKAKASRKTHNGVAVRHVCQYTHTTTKHKSNAHSLTHTTSNKHTLTLSYTHTPKHTHSSLFLLTHTTQHTTTHTVNG